jgi:hypothetical protein
MFERADDVALFGIRNWPDNAGITIVCFAELQRPNTHSILGFGQGRGKRKWLGTILIIILILLLIGALPTWGYSSGWGYYPGGGLGIILIIVIILVLMGRV